jgi:hypothetical protein
MGLAEVDAGCLAELVTDAWRMRAPSRPRPGSMNTPACLQAEPCRPAATLPPGPTQGAEPHCPSPMSLTGQKSWRLTQANVPHRFRAQDDQLVEAAANGPVGGTGQPDRARLAAHCRARRKVRQAIAQSPTELDTVRSCHRLSASRWRLTASAVSAGQANCVGAVNRAALLATVSLHDTYHAESWVWEPNGSQRRQDLSDAGP